MRIRYYFIEAGDSEQRICSANPQCSAILVCFRSSNAEHGVLNQIAAVNRPRMRTVSFASIAKLQAFRCRNHLLPSTMRNALFRIRLPLRAEAGAQNSGSACRSTMLRLITARVPPLRKKGAQARAPFRQFTPRSVGITHADLDVFENITHHVRHKHRVKHDKHHRQHHKQYAHDDAPCA